MKVTKRTGDVDQGKIVYAKNCANCHKHRGEGNEVGPDLTGMAVHPKEELLTHILDPSRSVEGNYRSYSVLTVDGIVIMVYSHQRLKQQLRSMMHKQKSKLYCERTLKSWWPQENL